MCRWTLVIVQWTANGQGHCVWRSPKPGKTPLNEQILPAWWFKPCFLKLRVHSLTPRPSGLAKIWNLLLNEKCLVKYGFFGKWGIFWLNVDSLVKCGFFGRSQTMFANFANLWPPTYLCLHWLTFGLPPTYLSTLTCDKFLPYIDMYLVLLQSPSRY